MKTIKMFQIALVITVLSIIAGCNDQLITPDATVKDSNVNSNESAGTGNSAVNRFSKKIKLKAHRSYTFNYSNTGFIKFHSINAEVVSRNAEITTENASVTSGDEDIIKLNDPCQSLYISSLGSDSDIYLNCKSSGFNLKSITVENTGPYIIEVYVVLTGDKKIILNGAE